MSGTHNLENAVAAAALATLAEVPLSVWTEALANFAGVKRRMEYRWRGELIYIDDYAHHPTEIERTIEAVRMHHPGRRITVIFQPHLYSRTRDQADEFARALGQVDHLILLPIYPARERPIPGVDSQWLFNKISAPHKELLKPELIFGCLEMHPPEVLLTLGAGDIDRLVPDLTKWAERQG
jgi:UDP-N-acetylmuramate--alanine ligase